MTTVRKVEPAPPLDKNYGYIQAAGGKRRAPQLARNASPLRPGVPEVLLEVPDQFVDPLLLQKLHSEVEEIANDLAGPEEYGDVLDVLEALMKRHGVTWDQVHASRNAKRDKRGDFHSAPLWAPEI